MSLGFKSSFKVNGNERNVVDYHLYRKTIGFTDYEVERFELDDGNTYIVMPTEYTKKGAFKDKLEELISQFKVKVFTIQKGK